MIQECLIFLSLFIIAYLSSVLFFKYISPKEKKELKAQRDKLFKDVEKLLKRENFIEVIETFDQIAAISEKLGELGISDEFKERANNIRRQLGQEVKADLSASQDEINAFIQQLLVGPYNLTTSGGAPEAEIIAAVPQAVGAPPKSLMEEGEEILARLAKFKGEGAPELVSTSPPPIKVAPPPRVSSMGPPSATSAPPSAPPINPPIAVPSSPRAPPMAPTSAAPVGPPVAVPSPPRAPSMAPTSAAPVGPPVAVPSPPRAPPAAAPLPTVPSAAPFTTTTPPPMAFPVDGPEVPSINPVDDVEILDSMEEPLIQGVETFIPSEPEIKTDKKKKKTSKKDEKAEILARIKQELPYLPDKKKKNIVKELLKRPEGKLRETWFKVYVHKNKQYVTKSG